MKNSIRKLRDNYLGNISNKSSLKIPYFVFTISIVITITVTYFFYLNSNKIDEVRFNNDVLKIQTTIGSRLGTYIALLRAGRGYISASDNINKVRFKEFVGSLRLETFYPSVQAIGFSKVFTDQEKDALENRMRSEGFLNFTITPETPRKDYHSIIYIEPFDERNEKALGFDMSSEPIRKMALDIARDTGVYAISGKVVLVQDSGSQLQPGFLIYLPIYQGDKLPETVDERRKQIDGYIYSPFRAFEFIKDVVNESKINTVSFKIYDNSINENNLLGVGNENETVTNSDITAQNEIEVGGRKWIITYTPSTTFKTQSLTWWTPIIFLLGLTTSVILFFLSLSQSQTNLKLGKIAKDLAQSETEVQKLLESEQEAREIAEKSNKVKDEFISIVSHEMRTPLNSISGWVNILKSDSLTKETKVRAIGKINKNLRSQVNLVEDMIDFANQTSVQNYDKWQKVSFSELVDKCLAETNENVIEQKLNLTKEFNGEKFYIRCDQEKVKKVVLHLLNNAIKFTPEGGKITLNINVANNHLELKIADTGEGIIPELLPNIFEIFNQSDSSTTRKHGGLGLSLAVARKIVEGHKGKITAVSEGLGKGSIFTITLPLSKN